MDPDVVVPFVSALLVQEPDNVHQFVYHRTLFHQTTWHLKIHVLPTTDSSYAAPATAVSGRDPNVITLLASVGFELNACVLMIIIHGVGN